MSDSPRFSSAHQSTFENIPWFVTGRVSPEESAAISLHIAICKECQLEFAAQSRIRAMILAPECVEIAPQASFQKLQSRIEETERELPAAAHAAIALPASDATPRGPSFEGALHSLRPLMLGQLAAGVLAASLLLWIVVDRWTAPRFHTATEERAGAIPGPALRVVVSSSMPVSEFAAMVQMAHGRVTDGPNAQGAWTIELPVTADERAQMALAAHLRADPRIVFAEPISRVGLR